MISQGNIIVGALIIAFIVYITVRGRLPAYLATVIGPSQGGTPGTSAGSSPPIGGSIADWLAWIDRNFKVFGQ